MVHYRNPALTTPTIGTIADHVGITGASRSLFACSQHHTANPDQGIAALASNIPHSTGLDTPFSPSWFTRDLWQRKGSVVHQQELQFVSNSSCDTKEEGFITSKHAGQQEQAVMCNELFDDVLDACYSPQLGQVRLSPDIDSRNSYESAQTADANSHSSRYSASPNNAVEALKACFGANTIPSSNSTFPLDDLAFRQLSNAQLDIRDNSRDIPAIGHKQSYSQPQWQKHPQGVLHPQGVSHLQATVRPFSSYSHQQEELALDHVNAQANRTVPHSSGFVHDSMLDFSAPTGHGDDDPVELHPSMRPGLKRKQTPMWLNTQIAAVNNHSQLSEAPSKLQKMPGLAENVGKHAEQRRASPQSELECAEQMWPGFIHQELFSPARNAMTPPGMADFDEASSPVPPWHKFPNMRHPSDANRRSIMQAEQELCSPAQMPQSLQKGPQTHAQSQFQLQQQLQDQTGGQQQHMPMSGAQHSTLLSQESLDFSEIAQWMGLLDQTASDCKPMDAPIHGESHAQKRGSFEHQTWAKSGAEACNSRLQMQPQTALSQDKGRTQSSTAQRPSTHNTAGGLPSAAPLAAWPMQSSSSSITMLMSHSLKTHSFGSASIKQESPEPTSLRSDSFKSDQDSALGSKVTATTSALACMIRKSHSTQQDYSSGFSKQGSEEKQFSTGSSARQTTSAEADSKAGGKPPLGCNPRPSSGRQGRVKRPPAHLADNIADAQPASKVAKGGKGKPPGGKAAKHGPAQRGSAQRRSAGSSLPAEEPGTIATLQPFDRFTGTISDAQFASINRKLETVADGATAAPVSRPSLSSVGSVRVYRSRSSTPTLTFHGAVKMPEAEHGGSRLWRHSNGSMFAGISVASNLVSPEDTWNCIDEPNNVCCDFPPFENNS